MRAVPAAVRHDLVVEFLPQPSEAGRGRRLARRHRRALHRLRVDRRGHARWQPVARHRGRIAGPAAAVLDQAFARTWEIAGGRLPDDDAAGRVTPQGDAEVRIIGGEPGRERTYRVIELLAAGSINRLWITDAYLVAPPRLFQALRDAARDGVDVRLLVPGSSDLPLVRNLSRIGYRDLLRNGVRIFEWDGPMLHAKTIVADGRWPAWARATSIPRACSATGSSTS